MNGVCVCVRQVHTYCLHLHGSTLTDPKKELWRLRGNWLFMTLNAALFAISYTSMSSSFHQFITNPREETINRSLPETQEVGDDQLLYCIRPCFVCFSLCMCVRICKSG